MVRYSAEPSYLHHDGGHFQVTQARFQDCALDSAIRWQESCWKKQEAVTAARDAARPLAPSPFLHPAPCDEGGSRASGIEQAKVIAGTVKDQERQARSADVVLEGGGDIGNLKFIKWGADWLSTHEVTDRLRSCSELAISFDGACAYDEDQDDVPPGEFRADFTRSQNMALGPRHDGGILTFANTSWPNSLTGHEKSRPDMKNPGDQT